MRLIVKLLMLVMVSAVLSGCSGAMMVFTDTKLSSETGLDCSVSRWVRNEPICIDPNGNGHDDDLKPNVTCYRTLGNIDCYEETDPYAAGARKSAAPRKQVAVPNLTPGQLHGEEPVAPRARPGSGRSSVAAVSPTGEPPIAVGGGSPTPAGSIPSGYVVDQSSQEQKEKWYNFSISKMWGTDYLKDQFKSLLTEKPFGEEAVPEAAPAFAQPSAQQPVPSIPGMQRPTLVAPQQSSNQQALRFKPREPVVASQNKGILGEQSPKAQGPKAIAVQPSRLFGFSPSAPNAATGIGPNALPKASALPKNPRGVIQPGDVTATAPRVQIPAAPQQLNVAPPSAAPQGTLPASGRGDSSAFQLFRSSETPPPPPPTPASPPAPVQAQPAPASAPATTSAPAPQKKTLSDWLTPRSGPSSPAQRPAGSPRPLFNPATN